MIQDWTQPIRRLWQRPAGPVWAALVLFLTSLGFAVAQNAARPTLPTVEKPQPEQPVTGLPDDSRLNKTPARQTKGLDLVKVSWTYNCMECHRILEVQWHKDRVRTEHEDILLQHGNNRFCLNCHNPKDMNTLYCIVRLDLVDPSILSKNLSHALHG